MQTPVIPVVAALIRQNPGTISLGQGVVHYGPPPEAAAFLSRFFENPENNKYKPVQGLPELVEALRKKLAAENGLNADPNGIFVTAGSNLGFMNALLAIADPGDEIVLQTPYYFNHEMAVTMANCRPVLVPTRADYQLDVGAIAAAITPKTRAVVTVSPNNPTGAVYGEESLRAVNRLCQERGVWHISDEAYEYFTYDGARHFSPGSIPDSGGHTISLYSLSKAYGFASWRVGYMVVPPALVASLQKIQDTLLICAPVVSQYAALGALEAGAGYCREQLKTIVPVREELCAQLRRLDSVCEVPRTDGAFYFFLKIRAAADPMNLVERLIRKHSVAVIPGSAFGAKDACYLRVAYGALRADTAMEGISRLAKGLRALLGGG